MVEIGKLCPKCKVGKLYPEGYREYREPSNKSEFYANTKMKCDKCDYEEGNIVAGVNE